MFLEKMQMPKAEQALPGREQPMQLSNVHYVLGTPLRPPFPGNYQQIVFGLGCFWGAEKAFWKLEGVYTTAVGYIAGFTPNPTYEEVCSGRTGHNEAVLVVFDPAVINLAELIKTFWQAHNPTQGMRQGNDRGTQYRSGIYVNSEGQREIAEQTLKRYQKNLDDSGFGKITTEILDADEFYYAEEYHQQYLAKNPNGYCGLGGTGVPLSHE